MENYLMAILEEIANLKNEVNLLRAENEYLKNIAIAGSPLFSEDEKFKAAEAVQQKRTLDNQREELMGMFK